MSREAHVQFCESLGVRLPGATHLLVLSPNREVALQCARQLEVELNKLCLKTKASQRANLLLTTGSANDDVFTAVPDFRHLGLLFRAGRICGSFARQAAKAPKSVSLCVSPQTPTLDETSGSI
jgi:hypothetical protein